MARATTFLGTRPADEAWPRVKQALISNNLSCKAASEKLGVVPMTLYRWFDKNPKYKRELEQLIKQRAERNVRA